MKFITLERSVNSVTKILAASLMELFLSRNKLFRRSRKVALFCNSNRKKGILAKVLCILVLYRFCSDDFSN